MRRQLRPELMDDPALTLSLHLQALNGLRRINQFSGIANQLLKPILRFADRRRAAGVIRLLDVACGGGDVPVAVAEAARQAGVAIELTMFDRSDAGLARAKALAMQRGVPARTVVGDAVAGPLPERFDVVTCSLFLHHLDESQTIAALTNMRHATGGLLLVSDLRRCVGGIIAAHVGCRVLSRSPIVHFDGPVSAHAAWTVGELKSMATVAGMPDAVVRSASPFRMSLQWENRDV